MSKAQRITVTVQVALWVAITLGVVGGVTAFCFKLARADGINTTFMPKGDSFTVAPAPLCKTKEAAIAVAEAHAEKGLMEGAKVFQGQYALGLCAVFPGIDFIAGDTVFSKNDIYVVEVAPSVWAIIVDNHKDEM